MGYYRAAWGAACEVVILKWGSSGLSQSKIVHLFKSHWLADGNRARGTSYLNCESIAYLSDTIHILTLYIKIEGGALKGRSVNWQSIHWLGKGTDFGIRLDSAFRIIDAAARQSASAASDCLDKGSSQQLNLDQSTVQILRIAVGGGRLCNIGTRRCGNCECDWITAVNINCWTCNQRSCLLLSWDKATQVQGSGCQLRGCADCEGDRGWGACPRVRGCYRAACSALACCCPNGRYKGARQKHATHIRNWKQVRDCYSRLLVWIGGPRVLDDAVWSYGWCCRCCIASWVTCWDW